MAGDIVIHTVRHAQSTYGAQKRYAGSLDPPLSDRGARDCVEAAAAVASVPVDVVVTSQQVRATDTARLLGYDPSKFERTALCNERRYGVLEGMTWEDVKALDPPVLFIEVGGDVHSVNPDGGEPFEDVWQRATQFKAYLLERHEGQHVLVVSHGVFLQMLHGVLRGSNCIESLAYYPSNLEMSTFRLSDGALVEESETKLLDTAVKGF